MEFKIDEHYNAQFSTQTPTTGAVTPADSAPRFVTVEVGATHQIVDTGTTTKVALLDLTAAYEISSQATAAKGFEVGKWYTIWAVATVGAIEGELPVDKFIIVPADVVREDVWSDARGGNLDNISAGAVTAVGPTKAEMDTAHALLTTPAGAADAVWDELEADHVVVGSYGFHLNQHLDVVVSTRSSHDANAVRDAILDDATRFSGGNIDAAVSSRSSHDANAVRDAILDDATRFSGGNIDAAISSRSSHNANAVRDAILDDATRFSGADIGTILTDTNEIQGDLPGTTLASQANQTTILARIGGVTGAGINTLLGFFRALMNKASGATPTNIGGTYSAAADSTEAIRDRGDSAWVTGGGGAAPTVDEINDKLVNEHGDAAWNRGWNMAVTVQNTTLTVTGGLIDGDGHIWLTRDDDHDIDITLKDASGVAINISADTLYLTVRESDEETAATDADATFQVLGTVISGVNGQARFEVGKTQTDKLTLNTHYYYDICLIADHGDVTTVIKGRLTNTGDVTRRTS